MKFSFSEEQEEFRSFLRRFLEEKSPTTEVRRLMATDAGWEKEQWRKVNTELGLTAIAIPEEYGGQGFGLSEQCIVLEEMGRSLLCAPYFSSAVLTANAILYGATEEYKKKYLPPKSFLKKLYKKFTPYCSVATWYLWRSIDDEPIQY